MPAFNMRREEKLRVVSDGTFAIAAALLLAISSALVGWGQIPDRIATAANFSQRQILPNHHPAWASAANDAGSMPGSQVLENLTLFLARSPEQQREFEQLLNDQQNPDSPEFRHWLTPIEMGERFGLSKNDIETIRQWLTSRGLHVNWTAPSRNFIGFGGTAVDIGRAFQTEIHWYRVGGEQRMSVSSDPSIPQALAPVIRAVHGLYTINVRSAHHAMSRLSNSPDLTSSNGGHLIVPGDFATIYDLPTGLTGSAVTIGIVGLSRTDMADFESFRGLTGSTFGNPTEIIPTAYGGVDPGPAQTTQASNYNGDQLEATLDVTRAGSIAPDANLLLVTSATQTVNGSHGIIAGDWDIEADIAYLVFTTPLPAQVMTISFGGCESGNGKVSSRHL